MTIDSKKVHQLIARRKELYRWKNNRGIWDEGSDGCPSGEHSLVFRHFVTDDELHLEMSDTEAMARLDKEIQLVEHQLAELFTS